MLKISVFLFLSVVLAFSKPMESLTNYNVILVHGAADGVNNGFECVNTERPYDLLRKHLEEPDSNSWNLGSAPGMLGSYQRSDKLTHWLDTKIFENSDSDIKKRLDSTRIYLQRSFTKPAGSPKDNGREIGYSKWTCGERRSLIEEAQEVRAKGRANLIDLRENVINRDRLPPSRNILIAHSMGGLASREYVQGNFYNNDVDKVITLDSPHKGTHSLDGLLDAKKYIQNPIKETLTQVLIPVIAFSFLTSNGGPTYDNQAVQWFATAIAIANVTNATVNAATDFLLGYDYTNYDPLVPYIRPGSTALNELNRKPYSDNLPMMRIFSSRNGLTFGSNKEYLQDKISLIVPDALYVPIKNSVAQISHTEISNPAYFNNIMASILLGITGGFSLTDHGSALIPHWSGAAENLPALHNSSGKSKFYTYDANDWMNSSATVAADIVVAAVAGMYVASKLELFNKPLAEISRLAIALTAGVALSTFMLPSTIAAVHDLKLGHEMPILKEHQSNWYGQKNTYSTIPSGSTTVTPYLMEEFLYERPFVNLRVSSANDNLKEPLESNPYSFGLLGTESSEEEETAFTSLAVLPPSATKKAKLSFKNSSDWEKLGVKIDRWEWVDGVEGPKTVPIRHADRYAMPDVSVTSFIEEYRFIVDDLMPHRLRQIRLNFNFREDIAWECDVEATENAGDACSIYTRSSGNEWVLKRKGPHPVKKDGSFDFKPADFDVELLDIQKDNQNAVIINTVNKIGLSNSQRFYYLFKATADLIEPLWPVYGAKLTSVKDFKIHANALDYAGFSVRSGKDQFLHKDDITINDNLYTPMTAPALNVSAAVFTSQSSIEELTDGQWSWHYSIVISDNNGTESVWDGAVPFTIKTTPPVISLEAKEEINPETSTFISRFASDESLRLIHMVLDKMEDGIPVKSHELPLLTNVIANEFGVSWDGLNTADTSMKDGIYRLSALAFDGAIGDSIQYRLMNDVAAGTRSVPALLGSTGALSAVQKGINASLENVYFIINRTAPEINGFALSAMDSSRDKPPHSLDDSQTLTLNSDRLLRMDYTLIKPLHGRDTISMHLSWEFLDAKDSTVLFRIGDNAGAKSDTVSLFWEESSQMKIPDGNYIIRMIAVDAAGNERFAFANKNLRVDRTAPVILSLFTSSSVYSQVSSNGYNATLLVAQRDEIAANRSTLKCYYRISGPNFQGREWIFFAEDNLSILANSVTLDLVMSSETVGAAFGKRYLEGGCMDAAGNFASTVDLFYIGHLMPSIAYPSPSSFPDQPVIAIRGIAPTPRTVSGDGKAAYRLRWCNASDANSTINDDTDCADDAEWSADGIDVGAGKRLSDETPWISNETTFAEDDLGFWDRHDLPNAAYWLELSTRECGSCDWVPSRVKISLGPLASEEVPAIVIGNPSSVIGGEKTELSVRIEGAADKDFRIRFYGSDSSGQTLFEASTNRLKNSPFRGKPSVSGKGIWFWEEAGKYNLQWSGLPNSESLVVAYRQGSIADICKNAAGHELGDCSEIPWVEIPKETEEILASAQGGVSAQYAELSGIPAGLNRAMKLSGSSGHLAFSNREAFYVNFVRDSLPVYFGSQETDLAEAAAIVGFFRVDPALYGLRVIWDGLTTAKRYPAAGPASLHAEVFENIPGGIVLRASKNDMVIRQPSLELVTAEPDTLADFYVVKQSESGLELGSKPFSYGIRGRDALVKAWIENDSGAVIKHLLPLAGIRQNAVFSKSAYKLLWDGIDEDEFVAAKEGTYKFVISAREYGDESSDPVVRSWPFKLTVAGMQLASGAETDIGGSALRIAEAVADSNNAGRQNYAPTADYLVTADLSGYTLPEDLRAATINYELGGTQVAQGYRPQRYSLAVKRQRDNLPLVILYEVRAKQDRMSRFGSNCHWRDGGEVVKYKAVRIDFTNHSQAKNIEIEYGRSGSGRGFRSSPNTLKVWAVTLNKYEGKGYKYIEADAKRAIDSINDLDPVWSTGDINIPLRDNSSDISFFKPRDGSCTSEDKADGKICSEKTEGYDPHANLFALTVSPGDQGKRNFFTDYGSVGAFSCFEQDAYKKISMNLKFEIPPDYWDAGYGYDNLVNRNIRLDHTNQTVFGENGYLKAYYDTEHGKSIAGLYYDGSNWQKNTNYGMLTPFESHRFPFVSAQIWPETKNIFLFPDEDLTYRYLSYFHAKFYNLGDLQGNFKVYFSGNASNDLSQGQRELRTGLLGHGGISINVVLEANPNDFPSDTVQIPYPANANWINEIKNTDENKVCPGYADDSWLRKTAKNAECLKFYKAGSKVHYYHGDYDDDFWKRRMLTFDQTIFKNQFYSSSIPMRADLPEAMLDLDLSLIGSKAAGTAALTVNLNPENYDAESKAFYLRGTDIQYPTTPVSGGFIKPIVAGLDASKYKWNEAEERLLFFADEWKEDISYRYTSHQEGSFPTIENDNIQLSLRDLYIHQFSIDNTDSLYKRSGGNWQRNEWIKNVSMANSKLTQLDGKEHTHFNMRQQDSSVTLSRKTPFPAIRPAELVSVLGRVPDNIQYQISYVVENKDGEKEFRSFKTGRMDGPRGTSSEPPLLGWLDVNQLQGNTSFFLSWGDGTANLMYRKVDLYIGKMLNSKKDVVESLFGEVSVSFPEKAVSNDIGITVRTANPEDYAFTAFNNVSLRGPIVEVLPSMEFSAPPYPRIKSRIHKDDLRNTVPARVRLYKVDFKSGQFVPLSNTLIGFLKANGTPAVEYSGEEETKMCEPSAIDECGLNLTWEYLLVSAETNAFSVFVALDSMSVVQSPAVFAVLPEISTDRIREVKVSGAENYRIYISDKPEWNAEGASQTLAALENGASGETLVTLPERLDSWLYLVPLNESGEETADLPASVHVQLIPSQISCLVPQDTVIWLGLDNGHLKLPQECNQPAMGTLQLRLNGSVVAEARQSLPDTLLWDGSTGISKIAHGEYSSRYIAVGAAGHEMQIIGPAVYTDTLRPVISSFSVEESSAVLDRKFRILANASDDLSGIGAASLSWSLSDVISGTVSLKADSSGNIDHALYISRKQLSQCLGCKLKISLRVEDKGHNWAEQEWQSNSLWPYPADLALWYPALEGGGKTAREYIGTGHDLDLLMPNPWFSASGIYFENSESKAPGKGSVDLGSTNSYTLETWIRPGYAASPAWQRILGFNSANGKRIELQINGKDLRLLDGTETWAVSNLSLPPKAWTHLIVSVSENSTNFYIDGKLAGTIAAAPSERLWQGSFSLGAENGVPSFIGHVMQARFYKMALSAEEAQALFKGITGEDSRIETTLAGVLDWGVYGMERGFSCAVPGSSYWGASKESIVHWNAQAGSGASHEIVLYARSIQPGEKTVKVVYGNAVFTGTVSLESVWRPVVLQGINLPLRAGSNQLELHLPAIDIAGIALSDKSLLPSQISWKSESNVVSSRTVAAQIRFEGHPDPSMIRPRIRLQNIGSSTIHGPKVRYYFRGEDPAQVQAHKYYPQEGSLVVRQEGDNLGYAEWSFPETTTLPVGQFLFWGEGPHFGLHNTNYVPWITSDDPSFANGAANSFVDAPGIIVLDSENRVLNGSCFENEMPLITTPVVQVLARDARADNQASHLYIKLENIGQVPIRDYEVRYSFYVSGGIVPVLDLYDMQGLSASLKNLGSGRWQVAITGSASLGPGISWANPAQFALRLPNWQSGWNTGSHPSHEGLSNEWAMAKGIEVFDAAGNRIYGKAPVWQTEVADNSSSSSGSSSSGASSAQIRVMAKQTRAHESNTSAVRFYVENLGSESISGFEVRYWLSTAPGKQLGYQVYNNTQFSADVVHEGGGLYSGRFVHAGTLAPGAKTEWGDGLEFFFYHSDWSAWNKESDFSNTGLGADFSEAHYIAVFDSNGNLIWGTVPILISNLPFSSNQLFSKLRN